MMLKMFMDEDFVNYKKPSMFIGTCWCDWKCCRDAGKRIDMCQNSEIAKLCVMNIPDDVIFERYISNPITSSVVIGGLEPVLQFDEVLHLLSYFRENGCEDDFVIYTGYTKDEVQEKISSLAAYKNVIVKFGRFVPGDMPHYDDVLGVMLANKEQHAERIS